MGSIGNMVNDLGATAPVGTNERITKLKMHIHAAIHDHLINDARKAILVVNGILATAIKQHGETTTRAYQDFIVKSRSGEAAAGHAMVKCFERDSGRSYEDLHATLRMEQGIDV